MLPLPDDRIAMSGERTRPRVSAGRTDSSVASWLRRLAATLFIEILSGSESENEKFAMTKASSVRAGLAIATACHAVALAKVGRFALLPTDAPASFGAGIPAPHPGGFAEFRNEIAGRRAIMNRRVEAMRDQLDLAVE